MTSNEELDRQLYTYPDDVLRNKLGIRDAQELERQERLLVADRAVEGVPKGNFDLNHLKAIHGHLFQDLYDWAGQVRRVEMRKFYWYEEPSKIEASVAKAHTQLAERGFLKGLKRPEFAHEASALIRDINFAHPFREGNGRTLIQYLNQLAPQAGHRIDIKRVEPEQWNRARMESPNKLDRLVRCIEGAISERERSRSSSRSQGRGRGDRDMER